MLLRSSPRGSLWLEQDREQHVDSQVHLPNFPILMDLFLSEVTAHRLAGEQLSTSGRAAPKSVLLTPTEGERGRGSEPEKR